MAEWPTVAEVKQSLGVTTDAKDSVISAALGSAIEQVAVDVGYRVISVTEDSDPPGTFVLMASTYDPDLEDDAQPDPAEIEPTYSLSQAALILAVMAVKAPDAPYGVAAVFDLGGMRVAAQHPTYLRMLTGHRLRFGVA